MQLSSITAVDLRSASVIQLPQTGISGVEMILPGGCTSTATSSCCSCGAVSFNPN